MRVSDRLNQVDSLVTREQYDSACMFLNNLGSAAMTEENLAHYRLLSTQLGYITNFASPSDSVLDMALAYYKEVGDNEKLADCYYYKSFGAELNQKYMQAIMYAKEAEQLSIRTSNAGLQFKIVESIAYLNGLCENAQLQLQYAKKALVLAQKAQNNNGIASSYHEIAFAFSNLDQNDSAYYYIEKSVPYFKYVREPNKGAYLANIGLLYKDKDPQKAKEYFEKSMAYRELPQTIEHLADIFYAEGNREKAYDLWKRALASSWTADYEKDNLIHSILSYDIERGKLDEAGKYLDEVIAIKDSIIYQLKNDTIKDLQLRFDHEVAMHEADNKLGKMHILLMGLAIALILSAFYAYFRKKKAEDKEKDYQDQLYAYTTEINQLTVNRDRALADIREMKRREEKDQQKIASLEEKAKEAEAAIKQQNKSIKKMLDDEAPKLRLGKMLFDQIAEGGTAVGWGNKEEELFNNYYAAINYQGYNKLRKVKRTANLSTHNLFYLILKEIGKSDEEVRRIMVLSPEGLRSIRNRTKPVDQNS